MKAAIQNRRRVGAVLDRVMRLPILGLVKTPAASLTCFVVAPAKRSGKSLVASLLAAALDVDWVASSDMVVERLEPRLGLAPGTIKAARHSNAESFRAEMVAEGNRMTADGNAPGVLCVRRGYVVIDGLRRGAEVADASAEARHLGRTPVVICVERASATGTDNSESDALRAAADFTIRNDGTIEDLAGEVSRLAKLISTPAAA